MILSAYEIVIKSDILMFCENEKNDLTDEQLEFLIFRDVLLDEVLEQWCNNGELTGYDDIIIALKEVAVQH